MGRKKVGKTHLNLGVLGKVSPGLPVILVEGVFDRDNVVLLDELVVDTSELLSSEPLGGVRVGVLEATRTRRTLYQLCTGRRRREKDTHSRSYLPSL